MHFAYIQFLYNVIYFVNNIICGWNLFLVLLTNDSSSIYLELPKKEVDISKSITYIRIYIYIYITLITKETCNFINNLSTLC